MPSVKTDLSGKVVGQIKLPTLDVSQYIGRKVKIESYEEYENVFKGQKSFSVKFTTTPVAILEDIQGDDGKPLELRASRFVGLQTDVDGNIGWGPETKMGLLLQKHGAKHYRDLVGKEVIVQIRQNKDGQEFLTF